MAASPQSRSQLFPSILASLALVLSSCIFGPPAAFGAVEDDLPVELPKHDEPADPTQSETFDEQSDPSSDVEDYNEFDDSFLEDEFVDLPVDEADDDADVEVALDVSISLSSTEVFYGDILGVYGTGFTPGSEVEFTVIPSATGVPVEHGWDTATEVDHAEPGTTYLDLTIYDWWDAGEHIVVATDLATGAEASATYTVVEDLAEPTLSVDPTTLEVTHFVGAPDQDGIGVLHAVHNLEVDQVVDYSVTAPDGTIFTEGTEYANGEGTVEFTVFGPDTSDLEDYVGDYRTEVSTQNWFGEEIVLDTMFHVLPAETDPADSGEDSQDGNHGPGAHGLDGDSQDNITEVDNTVIDPRISVDQQRVHAGAAVHVTGSGFTPGGEVQFELDHDLGIFQANDDGELATFVAISAEQAPGSYTLTAVDRASGETATFELEVVAETAAPTMTVDPTRITLANFVGDPQDGAGVVHRVDGMEPGTELVFLVSGPEAINDYEETVTVDADGVAQFVIYGYEVSNPEVYLGQYTTVVTYRDHAGNTAQLAGSFTVITDDGGPAPVVAGVITPADIGATDLAETGTTLGFLGLLAAALLLVGGVFIVIANRHRIFGAREES